MKKNSNTKSNDTPSMKVEWWPIDRPAPYEKNPRRNDGAVESVANCIREFGWDSPIVVDGVGVIIAGHTRLKAARKLGLETVPVLVRADLTPEQVAALRLADNKTAEIAEWDTKLLASELEALVGAVDMSQFGFADQPVAEFENDPIDQSNVFNPAVSLVVECESDDDAEKKLKIATEEMGWKAKLSIL